MAEISDTCAPASERTTRPIRIVSVTHFYPAHGGGLEKVAEKLIEGLAARGYRVCWFSSDTDCPPAPATDDVITVPVATTNFIERLTQLPYPIWSLWVLPRLWREIGNADAVHVHEHLYFPSILAMLVARLRRRPVVITQHIGALSLRSRFSTLLYKSGARLLGVLAFPLAAKTVFISRNVLHFFGCDRSANAQLIFNGVDTELFTPASNDQRIAIRRELHLPTDRKVVLFVGRFVRKKGLHRIAALAERFPEVLWVLVGSGPEQPNHKLPNLHVAGRVEHDRLPPYYQAADVLILPSSGEGLPLVVQEGLCCGIGIVSTDEVGQACPGAADLMRTRPVPRQNEDLAGWESALRGALDDPLYLGDPARERRARRARELWSWEGCVASYDELFNRLIRRC